MALSNFKKIRTIGLNDNTPLLLAYTVLTNYDMRHPTGFVIVSIIVYFLGLYCIGFENSHAGVSGKESYRFVSFSVYLISFVATHDTCNRIFTG